MTDEQRKRVHAITYSTDSREELAERIVKLEDEGLKLRVRLCEQYKDADQMEANEKKAVGENDKLRELAAEAIRLMQADGPDCGLCKHYGECWADEAMNYSPSGCVICSEARELGIEVEQRD